MLNERGKRKEKTERAVIVFGGVVGQKEAPPNR